MVCSTVSGKFSTDSLGSSVCCSGRFSLLSLILHSKSDTPGAWRFSLHVTLPELFLRKKRSLYHFPFRCFYIKRNPSKETQIIKKLQLSMCILWVSLSIPTSLQFCFAVITKRPVCCTEIQHEVITCYFRYMWITRWSGQVALSMVL